MLFEVGGMEERGVGLEEGGAKKITISERSYRKLQ